ncbi:MAG: PDZ domain-containing protein [Gemmataceae bacterium]|nr:PDZ domain-containing protein [Gemmataceae bacterium]
MRIEGIDLNWLEFDLDLTWAALFVHPDGPVYGRYGGRDAKDADSRNSLAGLRFAMEAALAAHREGAMSASPRGKPLYIEKVRSYAAHAGRGCVHCHQAKEILREEEVRTGAWDPESRWVYPLPENIGITLHRDRGDTIEAVIPGSPAAQVGLIAGDTIVSLNGLAIHSFADAQYALHKAPRSGELSMVWKRGGVEQAGKVRLADGWKRTNITWRPSLMDLLPSLPLFGSDLTPQEKRSLGLAETQLAFRQEAPLSPRAKNLGVLEGDVIIGINRLAMTGTMDEFLAYVRRNYLQGDRVTLQILRNGRRLDLPIRLP